MQALDRVLTTGRYVIPFGFSRQEASFAYNAGLAYPAQLPVYGDWIGWLPEVWWRKP